MKKMTARKFSQRKIFIYRILLMAPLAVAFIALAAFWSHGIQGDDGASVNAISGTGYWAAAGIFVFDETVVYAPCRGSVIRRVDEGQRGAKGQAVALLRSGATDLTEDDATIPLKAPAAGLVSYNFDGLEEVVTPDNIQEIAVDELLNSEPEVEIRETPDFCKEGQAVYKTINNQRSPLLAVALPESLLAKAPEIGEKWQLTVNKEETEAAVMALTRVDKGYVVIFRLPTEDKWFAKRFVAVMIKTPV
ncbi:MAG: HlyD family efflux transporter periplasmic adaptor subunit [Bacillota bacterium]|nr:HlyD family efflux transporter periplasmic adaptor subunit [Bacillota bacterium]